MLTSTSVLLEQRVAVVEANTAPGAHESNIQPTQSSEDAHQGYDLPNIDPTLSNGSEIERHFPSESSMAGLRSLTPRSLEGEPLHRTRSMLSVETLLCEPNLAQSCRVWFEQYHAWFPLMHQQTLMRCLEGFTTISDTGRPLVFQAVAAATLGSISHQDLMEEDVKILRTSLKNTTILAALNSPSLDSIQALLVLSMLQYGNSCLTEAGNLLAMCRKYVSIEKVVHKRYHLLTYLKDRDHSRTERSCRNILRHYDNQPKCSSFAKDDWNCTQHDRTRRASSSILDDRNAGQHINYRLKAPVGIPRSTYQSTPTMQRLGVVAT